VLLRALAELEGRPAELLEDAGELVPAGVERL
jgi:hypothetical protein